MTWIAFTLILICYYGLHSLMASLYIKRLFMRVGMNDQIYRILFNIIAITTTVGIIYGYLNTHTEYDQQGSYLGLGMVFVGLVIITVSLINYDLLAFIGFRKEKASAHLVVTGLNSYLRHPLYLGIIIALIGLLIFLPTGASFSTFAISFLYILFGIHLEEKKLIQHFGSSYLEYIENVPKLIPKFQK